MNSQVTHVRKQRPFAFLRFIVLFSAGLACVTPAFAQTGHAAAGVAGKPDTDGGKPFVSSGQEFSYAKMPLRFEPNRGQAPSGAQYLASGAGYLLRFSDRKAVLDLGTSKAGAREELTLAFSASRRRAAIDAEELLASTSSYIHSSDPAQWQVGVPNYGRIRYRNLTPGVDLAFYGRGDRLEYDYILAPGVRPSAVRLNLQGAQDARMDDAGGLLIQVGSRTVLMRRPTAWQPGAGPAAARRAVEVRYRVQRTGGGKIGVGFDLGPYDPAAELVIDPVLDFATALSTTYTINGNTVSTLGSAGVATDSAGNSYVLLSTSTGTGGFAVLEFSPAGVLRASASVSSSSSSAGGGAGYAVYPAGLAVSAGGTVYVTGAALGGLPTTPNAYQAANPNGASYFNAFLAALSPALGGFTLTYASYLGGTGNSIPGDFGSGVAVDASGNAYITGMAGSQGFPTTAGAYQGAYLTGATAAVFAAKFNPNASGSKSLVWSTLLGQSNAPPTASYSSIAVDSAGSAYIAATIQWSGGSPAIPVTSGALQYSGYAPGQNLYLAKLTGSGAKLGYATYLGPAANGAPAALAVDGSGEAYVAGTAAVDDFPTTAGAYQTSYPGAFALEVNPTGTALVYSTFLGGPSSASNLDEPAFQSIPNTISLPAGCAQACNAYIAGSTRPTDFPLTDQIEGAPDPAGQSAHAFAVELKGDGSGAVYSTYLGGKQSPEQGIGSVSEFAPSPFGAVDVSGNFYLAGNIQNGPGVDFPYTPAPAPVATPGAPYLAKIGPAAGASLVAIPDWVSFSSYGFTVGVTSTTAGIPAGVVTLGNLGSQAVSLAPLQITGPEAAQFAQTNTCGAAIAAASSCTVTVTFTPSEAQMANQTTPSATLEVNSAANAPLISVPIFNGAASDGGYLTISGPLSFPDVAVGSSAGPQILTVKNIGDRLVTFVAAPSVTSTSENLGGFTYTTTCLNGTGNLAPGKTCTIAVTFQPEFTGYYGASISLESSAGTVTANLSGVGIQNGIGGAGSLEASATALNFGAQLVGSPAGAPQQINLTNTGTVPVEIVSAAVTMNGGSAGEASDFAPEGTCAGQPLNPFASCQLIFTFTPSAPAVESATLSIVNSTASSPLTVALSGTGLPSTPASLIVTPYGLEFPSMNVGVTSTSQLITVYNDSTAAVTIDRSLITGDFALAGDGCSGMTLPAASLPGRGDGGTCQLYVTFTPTVAGTRTGTLTFVDSAGNIEVSLFGTGAATPPVNAAVPNTLSVVFPGQPVGTTSAIQQVTLTNGGSASFTVQQPTISAGSGEFSIDSTSSCIFFGTLLAGESCVVNLRFNPTAIGSKNGTLTIPVLYNGATTPTKIQPGLEGIGVAATDSAAVSPTVANLLAQAPNNPSPAQSFTLTNTGNVAFAVTSVTGTNYGLGQPFSTSLGVGVDACTGQTLPAATAAVCSVAVQFSAAVNKSGTLTFNLQYADGTTGTVTATLNGIVSPLGQKGLYFTAPSVNFPNEIVGTTSQQATVYLVNPANTSVAISSIAVSGSSASQFTLTNSCGGTLSYLGASCPVGISFTPVSAGAASATLTETDLGPGGSGGTHTSSIPLSGVGVASTSPIVVSPASLSFLSPSQTVGVQSAAQAVTVSVPSTGNTTPNIAAITNVVSSDPSEFPITASSCGSGSASLTLGNGGQCIISVAFKPSVIGPRSAKLTFTATMSGSSTAVIPVIVPLTGGEPLTVTAIGATSTQAGVLYSITFTATGGTAPYTFSSTQLPEGLTLQNSNGAGVVSGRAWIPSSLSYVYTVTATDANGNTGTLTVKLKVLPAPNGPAAAPVITPSSGTFTNAFPAKITDTTPGYLIYYTLNGSGVPLKYTGPLTVSQSETIRAGAVAPNYSESPITTATYKIPLTILTKSLPNGSANSAYSQTISVIGGTGGYTFSSNGALDGLNLGPANGVLSGTPLSFGAFSFTVTVKDSSGDTATQAYTLNVCGLTISPSGGSLPWATIGDKYLESILYSNNIGAVTLAVAPGNNALPAWLKLDNTGLYSNGVTGPSGQSEFSILATDGAGCSLIGNYTLEAAPPLKMTVNLPPASYGLPYSGSVTASGGAAPYSYSYVDSLIPILIPGLNQNSSTGAITGTPTQTGTFDVLITATDSNGLFGGVQTSLTVTNTVTALPVIEPLSGSFCYTVDGTPLVSFSDSIANATIYYTVTAGTTGTTPVPNAKGTFVAPSNPTAMTYFAAQAGLNGVGIFTIEAIAIGPGSGFVTSPPVSVTYDLTGPCSL